MNQDIRTALPVKLWFGSAGHDRAAEASQESYLAVLAEFCNSIGMSPEQLINFCFLRKKDTGERFASVKRRGTVNEWIEKFVQEQGWTGKEGVVRANVIRGFLIHNGVLLQGKIWTGA